MKNLKITWNQPNDRITSIGNAMIDTLLDETAGEEEEVWAIIFLTNGRKAGIALHGYGAIEECIPDLFEGTKAILETQGIGMEVHDVRGKTPEGPLQ